MKKALITGASEGIGRVLTQSLAKEGYSITAIARNEPRLKELLASLVNEKEHRCLKADLSKPEGVESVSRELDDTHYDLLVNNAGFGAFGKFHEMPFERIQEMSRVNCDALAKLSYAFLKKSQKGDALLNVASTASFHGLPLNAFYAATKAFVLSLTEALWYEQKERGVYVFALCPGYTLTEFVKRAGAEDRDNFRKFAQTPEEVAQVALAALRTRQKPFVISGFQNSALAKIQKLIPRHTSVKLAAATYERFLNR
ncbi:MAG: SDR family NAD(P)-dependent oxidoreductase [Bdellovibrionota bacterium]